MTFAENLETTVFLKARVKPACGARTSLKQGFKTAIVVHFF